MLSATVVTSTLVNALAAVIGAFAVSAVLTHRLSRSHHLSGRMLDLPNERSLHDVPVPRTGGIAILTSLAVAYVISIFAVPAQIPRAWIAGALALVALVSFLDDRGEVKAQARLAAHLLAAVLLLAAGLRWSVLELPGVAWTMPAALAYVLTLVHVIWMINLYNFMDGMDGFAGGMAAFGFASLAALGWLGGDAEFALLNAVIAASSSGFLLDNYPPARIFLGDAGSATLGLLATVMFLVGNQRGLFPLWVAWLAFSPFLVDATWTLLRRAARGEPVWQAHRSHHYQRLVLSGWSHRKTVLWSYALMVACGLTSVAAADMSVRDQGWLLAAWAAIYVLIAMKIRLIERRAGLPAP